MADFVPVLTLEECGQVPRLESLKAKFIDIYGKPPTFACRAPGRVNIIGEHIDYCGYAVLPMAIEQDILIAGSKSDEPLIRLANTSIKYQPYEAKCHEFEISKTSPKWYHYFLCGYKGILERSGEGNLVGLNILVDGNVPSCAGLSSSSALVCSSALTTMLATEAKLTKLELAETCQSCERYIGTEGGGMDQSISFLAQKGMAKMVEFNPIRGTNVVIPEGGVFVVANSCVEMHKAATDHFNIRVAECRLAAQVLASKNGLEWREVKRLVDVQMKLGLSLEECSAMVEKHLHEKPFTKQEICLKLGVTEEELDELSLSERSKHVQEFKLRDRAMHVYSEANRVRLFKNVCDAALKHPQIDRMGALSTLGQLMNVSHRSCSDDYECSCKALDDLVEHAQSNGALGSRMTGAGWGGCCVSLVAEEDLDKFLAAMKAYYREKGFSEDKINSSLFATQPGSGAFVIDI